MILVRIVDILFTLIALFILSPLLAAIAITLRITGEHEIFYRQKRIGLGGEEFHLLKFATMLKNSASIGSGTITIKNDPRVLPFGKILRKSKLNELPQLFNVLSGKMSLIGPRPVTFLEFEAYSLEVQDVIKELRPGLSGIGSIVFRDEESLLSKTSDPRDFYNTKIAPYKGELEKWYSEHQSLTYYFILIGLTIWCVLFQKSRAPWILFKDLPRNENLFGL